jgi:hypothetical protein
MGSPASTSSAERDEITDTERAVLGFVSAAEALSFFSTYAGQTLGSPIAKVGFRAGRIDAVWGVELEDGREVVIKSHRLPVDLESIAAARDAQRTLKAAGFPCPEPLSGPDEVEGRVLTVETLLGDGEVPDGRDPQSRRLLAAGLAWHVDILRGRHDLLDRAGSGPSWCHYGTGPWPVPHDPIVDFRSTPDGYGWLDAYAQRAADQILAFRTADEMVVGHADWYGGNTAVSGGVLVGTFDWELVADADAVIAGFTAACYAASSTNGGGLSTPEEVTAFLQDYAVARGAALTGHEQRAAAGAAAWILAFNARWELALGRDGHDGGATLALLRERREDYLSLAW